MGQITYDRAIVYVNGVPLESPPQVEFSFEGSMTAEEDLEGLIDPSWARALNYGFNPYAYPGQDDPPDDPKPKPKVGELLEGLECKKCKAIGHVRIKEIDPVTSKQVRICKLCGKESRT